MTAAIYNEHFGFHERPFAMSPDADFLFWSKAHTRAFSVLEYGVVNRALLTVITGEVGTGKTTLIQALLGDIEDNVTVGLISNVHGGRGALLRWVLNAFDRPASQDADYVTLFQQFQDFVLAEYAAGRHVLLIVDEAQNIEIDTLEELRLLTNVNSGKDDVLQIIMVGQPELRATLRLPELRQLAQRVMATYHLEPMTLETTVEYVAHRLRHAGGTGQEFTAEALRYIHDHAGGVPRMVNKLCDLALVYAVSAKEKRIELATIKEITQDGLIFQSSHSVLALSNPIINRRKAAE